jgi:deoxyribodipyrimidine photolyase-related protein
MAGLSGGAKVYAGLPRRCFLAVLPAGFLPQTAPCCRIFRDLFLVAAIDRMTLDRSGLAWTRPRRVVWVLGDQLWFGHPALLDFDPAHDHVLMVEAPGEAAIVWSHKARIALGLSAMRHFCNQVHRRGWAYTYVRLEDQPGQPDLDARALQVLRHLQAGQLRVCEPGEWRLLDDVRRVAHAARLPLEVLPDPHFLCSRADFARWALGRKVLRHDLFYRAMRQRHQVLMDGDGPVGGQWAFESGARRGYPAGGLARCRRPSSSSPTPSRPR